MADLHVDVNGIRFRNPVLPAAGPNVRDGAMMAAAAAGGAGAIVSKTVSTRAAHDPRPTIRRTSNGGLVNCETWSEIAVEDYMSDLRAAKATGLPLIVSIGYRPEEVARLGRLIEREIAPDAFEFSTHYTGREAAPLVEVARSLREAVTVPVWMKVSPNFPDICGLARAVGPWVDAFVAINSYGPVLDFDPDDPLPLLGSSDGGGWLSGPPIRPIALRVVRDLFRSQEKPVIGVGGIASGLDAVRFLMAGAALVQVCTAAIEEGHGVYGRIAAELDAWLEAHGHDDLSDVRGLFPTGPALDPPVRHDVSAGQSASAGPAVITVDVTVCTGCKACVIQCIHGALFMDGRTTRVRGDRCIGCGYCLESCRYGALHLEGETA